MMPNQLLRREILWVLGLSLAGSAQITPVTPHTTQAAVPYTSVSQLNGLLGQLEQASQLAQADLEKLRIDKWKTESANKRQTQGNVDSIQRNLQSALPEIMAELKASPESLASTFKLYRNLDALYDVFASVAESAGAFGSKDEFQSVENDVSAFEKSRRSFAERMQTLAEAREAEVARLRAALQAAQTPSEPPKKIVVDDEPPVKKPAKKKPASKPAVPQSTPAQPKPQ